MSNRKNAAHRNDHRDGKRTRQSRDLARQRRAQRRVKATNGSTR